MVYKPKFCLPGIPILLVSNNKTNQKIGPRILCLAFEKRYSNNKCGIYAFKIFASQEKNEGKYRMIMFRKP